MTFLAIIGALALTLALGWVSLVYAARFYYSDESIWFGFKNNPIAMVIWLAMGAALVGMWVLWFMHIASHITVGLS